jgi:hypothetical protein
LGFLGYFLITQYGPLIIDEVLKSQVKSQTNGQYVLDYSSLEISMFNKQVVLRDLELTKKDKSDSIQTNETYYIFIPKIEIDLASIIAIYTGKELKIIGIKVHDPKISITRTGEKDKSQSTLTFESGSIYKAISEYLSTFSIDKLNIDNASVNFIKPDTQNSLNLLVNQIHFSISNFLLDSLSDGSSKFLYSDNIELIIHDQKFELADSIHNVSFESFHISTKTGDILFRNLLLEPRASIDLSSSSDYLQIAIPELNFRGLDFNKAYELNKLSLDSIRILNPRIIIRSETKGSKKKNSNLIRLSTAIFDQLNIGKLFLDNAYLDITAPEGSHLNQYKSSDIDIVLFNVQLDSIIIEERQWLNIFDDFSINARNFETFILDSTHILKTEQFSYATSTNNLSINDLNIRPIRNLNHTRPILEIQSDLIEAKSISSLQNLLKGKIEARSMDIINPKIAVSLPDSKSKNFNDLKDLAFEYIKMKQFNIKNGELIFNQGKTKLIVSELSSSFEKLNLTPLAIKNINIQTICPRSNIQWKNLSFNSEHLTFSVAESKFQDWHNLKTTLVSIQPSNTPKPFTFNSIEMTAFDMDHFIHNQLLAFDTLIIDKPNIELHPINDGGENIKKLSIWAHHTNFKEVKIKNGTLTKFGEKSIQAKLFNFDAELTKFHYDSIQHEYYTHIGYRSDSIFIHLEKMQHNLTAKNLSISIKDSTLDAKHLKLKPASNALANKFNISAIELKLRQIDFHHLINTQQLHFQEGYFISPEVTLLINEKRNQIDTLQESLIKFSFLSVANGKLHAQINRNDSTMLLDLAHTNILIHDYDHGHDSTIFGAQNYLGEINEFSLFPFGSDDRITLKSAFVNTKEGDIRVDSITIKPNNQLEVRIPKMKISGFEPLTWAHERIIKIDSIIIETPAADLDLNQITPDKNPNFPPIITNHFSIENGNVNIQRTDLNLGEIFNINEINLEIDSLKLHKNIGLSEIESQLKNAKLSMQNIGIRTPDSLYTINLKRIEYYGAENSITVRNFHFDPTYNRKEFQTKIQYQKDWFDIRVSKMDINGMDFNALFLNNGINIENITLSGLDLDTHRDKRLPLPPNFEKALPQLLIANFPVQANIKNLNVKSAYISHSEFSPTGKRPGSIFFRNVNGTITNITNRPEVLANNPIMTFKSSGTLMNAGLFDINAYFDMTDTAQSYQFDGYLKEMDLTELNRLLENTAHVQITSGHNKLANFNFSANNDYALGTMTFYYNNLKIKVLNEDEETGAQHGSSLKSFFANTFVVDKKNPHLFFVREGDIFYERDTNKGIFNYWAKSLLSGVVSSIGAHSSKKDIKELNKRLKADIDQNRSASSKNQ